MAKKDDSRSRLERFFQEKNTLVPNKDLLPDEIEEFYVRPNRRTTCRVCRAGTTVQALVNRMLVSGATHSDVLETVRPLAEANGVHNLSIHSIRGHGRNHLPYLKAAMRKIMEKNAEMVGKDVDEGSEYILNTLGYAEAMMARAYETLNDPNTRVSPRDGLEAAKAYTEMHSKVMQSESVEDMRVELSRIINAVNSVVSEEQREQIANILQGRSQGVTQTPSVIEEDTGLEEQDWRNMENPNHTH